MAQVTVTNVLADAFRIDVRGHSFEVDQPAPDGTEAGPTPVEIFVASLGACAGYYAGRFLRARGLPADGLRVRCEWAMRAGEPARVGRVRMAIQPPTALPAELHGALLAAVDRCTVTNSLRQPPRLDVDLDVPLGAVGTHT
ncbi:OsmC family protein [Solwaraspora sp. WMMD1047]|uniref:OsmC family protein n=1 Tax=Solwaraspora sp. WMMD1047 TaxID=3016102 RepID=UPI002417ADD9|nr:OsmC family protein [Solwaraspora sp. WMMD1047]MDG4830893.1 OsmC family protein [Solwaraspora sp. WMMD1047]